MDPEPNRIPKIYVCYGCRKSFESIDFLRKHENGWFCDPCFDLIIFNKKYKGKNDNKNKG